MNRAERSDRQRDLLPPIAAHVEALGESPGEVRHPEAAEALAGWIAANLRPGEPLPVIVVCTGNSRRSLLGASMGHVAASYHGLPEVRFSSGGTEPTAFNPRTISTLRAVGVEISPTGEEAPRGPAGERNPIHRVRWGPLGGPSSEAVEFSKRFDDPSNPRSGFAALMVCDEADASCPNVPGASIRLAIPFEDPKRFDGTPEEDARYAECRDDLARWMLRALSLAQRALGR